MTKETNIEETKPSSSQDPKNEENNMIKKLTGFEFWKTTLNSAKYIVAPMVDQSELAWRLLTRKYGATLCYTPMYHARMFADEKTDKYRKEMFDAIEGQMDRPLIVQFCSNDPDHFLKAAKLVQDKCDAVDLNLGCPQHIARRGNYGSYLQDEWELIERMVKNLHDNLNVPITCKIRIFPDVNKTVKYAKMLENAGCQLLTVHGRIREQKGHNTGLADWQQIKIVKQAVNIPVFANGNILYFEDIQKCLDATGVEGVMSAEATLYNPALFSGKEIPIYEIAEEYMQICKDYKHLNKVNYTRAHLFKLYRPCLSIYTDLREKLATSQTFEDFENICEQLNARLKEEASKTDFKYEVTVDENGIKQYPFWLCQPYIRPPNEHNKTKIEIAKQNEGKDLPKRKKEKNEANVPNAKSQRLGQLIICPHCPNVASAKCVNLTCKQCCKTKYSNKEGDSTVEHKVCEIHGPKKSTKKIEEQKVEEVKA